jgi:hypothetical protein
VLTSSRIGSAGWTPSPIGDQSANRGHDPCGVEFRCRLIAVALGDLELLPGPFRFEVGLLLRHPQPFHFDSGIRLGGQRVGHADRCQIELRRFGRLFAQADVHIAFRAGFRRREGRAGHAILQLNQDRIGFHPVPFAHHLGDHARTPGRDHPAIDEHHAAVLDLQSGGMGYGLRPRVLPAADRPQTGEDHHNSKG